MALRASESFTVWVKDGKQFYDLNAVVPPDVAKGRESLVYDDTVVVEPEGPFVRTPSPFDPDSPVEIDIDAAREIAAGKAPRKGSAERAQYDAAVALVEADDAALAEAKTAEEPADA
jgi:hypothetical protein